MPSRPPRYPAGSLRKQRGAAGEYTRDLEQLAARHSAAVHSALSRAECAEHGMQELRWQLAQQRNSTRIDCKALRQLAALASVREELALARAERAQRELAVLKGELRQLREERGPGCNSGSEATAAAGEAVQQPGTPPTVMVRKAALKSALKRPGSQEKKKKKVRSACGGAGCPAALGGAGACGLLNVHIMRETLMTSARNKHQQACSACSVYEPALPPALSCSAAHPPTHPPARPAPRAGPRPKTQHLRFHDQLVNARYFWRDAAPSHVVRGSTLPFFLSAVSRHHRRERRASSSVGSMRFSVTSVKSQHAAQRVGAGVKEAVSVASMAQLLGRGEAVTGSSSLEATLKSLFAAPSQQPRMEVASPVMAAGQLRVAEEPSPLAALAERGCAEDVAAPPAAAAKAEAGNVVRLVAVAAC